MTPSVNRGIRFLIFRSVSRDSESLLQMAVIFSTYYHALSWKIFDTSKSTETGYDPKRWCGPASMGDSHE